MTRCINCTRCTRFGEELCGFKFFGSLNRGKASEIGNYIIKLSLSEISANVIDLCPVGALTLKSIPFQIRPWEVFSIESIDLTDSLGSNIYITYKGIDIFRVIPKKNNLINNSWISNKARFYYNLSSFLYTNINIAQKNSEFFLFNGLKQIDSYGILLLFNSDLDLQFYYYLNSLFKNNKYVSTKILSTSLVPKNFYFWGNKNKIFDFKFIKNSICFLISIDLKIELPLLDIRLRSKIIHNNFSSFGLNIFFKSNFPIQFLRFSLYQTFFLFIGKQIFSLNFLKKKILIFSNKNFLNRLDSTLILLMKKKLNILLYIPSYFCNSEGLNIMNFKSLNLKELNFIKFIFGLSLDDNYLIRKLLPKMNDKFFWVNKFYSDILKILPQNSWFYLEINQMPGYFLNFEQKIQKFNLNSKNLKFTLIYFIFLIHSKTYYYYRYNMHILDPDFYETDIYQNYIKYPFSPLGFKFLLFQYLFEVLLKPNLFYFKNKINLCTLYSSYFFYKKLACKVLFEDLNRTSLQLKNINSIIKNSQLSRLSNYHFYS
jgi:hypothetical protein